MTARDPRSGRPEGVGAPWVSLESVSSDAPDGIDPIVMNTQGSDRRSGANTQVAGMGLFAAMPGLDDVGEVGGVSGTPEGRSATRTPGAPAAKAAASGLSRQSLQAWLGPRPLALAKIAVILSALASVLWLGQVMREHDQVHDDVQRMSERLRQRQAPVAAAPQAPLSAQDKRQLEALTALQRNAQVLRHSVSERLVAATLGPQADLAWVSLTLDGDQVAGALEARHLDALQQFLKALHASEDVEQVRLKTLSRGQRAGESFVTAELAWRFRSRLVSGQAMASVKEAP